MPDFFREGDHHSIPELLETWQQWSTPEGSSWEYSTTTDSRGSRCSGMSSRPASSRSLCCSWVVRTVDAVSPSALMDEMDSVTRSLGARALYVSAVPSESAVRFCLSRGFRPTEPLPEPFDQEPEDIHMLLPLSPELRDELG